MKILSTTLVTLTILFEVSSSPAPLTQEQLAQYVAVQQTQQAPAGATPQHAYVTAALPRQRAQPAYQESAEQTAQQLAYDEYQAAAAPQYRDEQSGNQQRAILYYKQQQQPQFQPRPIQYKQYPSPGKLRADQLAPKEQSPEDYDPNPQYQFSFDIKDDDSTNYHNRKETRDGDKISGSYSVVDSDGYIRTVTYTADPKEGFKADVNRQPTDIVVKLPKHPTPGLAQQYQQISPSQALTARKQQTQQYLEASSPIDAGEQPQYILKQQPQQVYIQPQPARSAAPAYFTSPHRLSPSAGKAPRTYSPVQQTIPEGISPLLYKAAYPQQ